MPRPNDHHSKAIEVASTVIDTDRGMAGTTSASSAMPRIAATTAPNALTSPRARPSGSSLRRLDKVEQHDDVPRRVGRLGRSERNIQ